MSYKHHWANPSTTSGWQNYPGGWVYTGGIPMPTARLDFGGNRPIRVHSFGDFYISSGFMRMNYNGNILDQGGVARFPYSGGSFQWEAHSNSQMFFGRDRGQGRTVTSFNDGFVWDGTLAGSFWWDQVPNPPGIGISVSGRNVTVTVFAPDDGGTPIHAYGVELSINGGAWGNRRAGGTTTYQNVAPGTYQARTWADNAVGSGQPSYSGVVTVRAGGRRWNGSAWNPTGIARRWNGSQWVDLTIARRWNGSAWVDLS